MIEIVRDQVVYNAGSHLEVACIYKNTTGRDASARRKNAGNSKSEADGDVRPRLVEDEVRRILEASRNGYREEPVPEDAILWLHNGETFSHRNRRRYVPC